MALAKYYEDILERKLENTKVVFHTSSDNNKIKWIVFDEAQQELESLKTIILKEINNYIKSIKEENFTIESLEFKNKLRDKEFELKFLLELKEKREEKILSLAEECDQLESKLIEANEKIKLLEKQKKMLKKKLKNKN